MRNRTNKSRAWWWNAEPVGETTHDGFAPDCPFSGGVYGGGHGTAASAVSDPVPYDVALLGAASLEQAMEFIIPEPLTTEHSALHAELVDATKEGGRVGEAAKEVARLLHPHFIREEEFALPPLACLEHWRREP